MLHGSTRPDVAGSELNRLLAHLGDTAPADSRPVFVERLGHWLGWTGAIALSEALVATAAPAAPGRSRSADAVLSAGEADFQRVCAVLAASIAAGPAEPASSPTDFGPYRRHIAERQQAMQDAIAALRQRLRDALARQSAAGARLAAIDAVMDRSLAAQERSLLALVSLRLQARFERLSKIDAAAAAAALPSFHDDMARVLQAELAHRLLPAQGLLDALRSKRP